VILLFYRNQSAAVSCADVRRVSSAPGVNGKRQMAAAETDRVVMALTATQTCRRQTCRRDIAAAVDAASPDNTVKLPSMTANRTLV